MMALQGSEERRGLLAMLLSGLTLNGLRTDNAADISDQQPWTAALMACRSRVRSVRFAC